MEVRDLWIWSRRQDLQAYKTYEYEMILCILQAINSVFKSILHALTDASVLLHLVRARSCYPGPTYPQSDIAGRNSHVGGAPCWAR